MKKPIFEAKNLAYSTPSGRLLQKNLSLAVQSGQMLLISGSNGCGKSTLLRAMLGKFPAKEGSIQWGLSSRSLEYIPQLENTEIHLPVTLRDVLMLSLNRRVETSEMVRWGLLNEEQLDSAWNTASGGERKRTLLTRALLRNPSILVFDEPMNHLDAESRKAMIRMMARFLTGSTEPRAILMVCHQGLDADENELFDVVPLDLDAQRKKEGLQC